VSEREFIELFAAFTDKDALLDVFSGAAGNSRGRPFKAIVDRLGVAIGQVIATARVDGSILRCLLLDARLHR